MAKIRIGISGWPYPPWHGVFIGGICRNARNCITPRAVFPSIELSGSFYLLQYPKSHAC